MNSSKLNFSPGSFVLENKVGRGEGSAMERDILLTRSREIDIWTESSPDLYLLLDAKRPLHISLRAIPPVIGNHSLQPLPTPARTSVEITLGQ